MAYVSQEMKKVIAERCKKVAAKYGMKVTYGVRHHSTFVANIASGKIDFGTNDRQVNHHWIKDNYTGAARDFLLELKEAINADNHDNSDLQSDYFDVGYYVDINIGKWDKPYVLTV